MTDISCNKCNDLIRTLAILEKVSTYRRHNHDPMKQILRESLSLKILFVLHNSETYNVPLKDVRPAVHGAEIRLMVIQGQASGRRAAHCSTWGSMHSASTPSIRQGWVLWDDVERHGQACPSVPEKGAICHGFVSVCGLPCIHRISGSNEGICEHAACPCHHIFRHMCSVPPEF